MNRLRAFGIEITLVFVLLAAVGFFAYLGVGLMQSSNYTQEFNGERALSYANKTLEFGPRVAGSEASQRMGDWLAQELVKYNWDVLIEPFTISSTVQARNIIAVRGPTNNTN